MAFNHPNSKFSITQFALFEYLHWFVGTTETAVNSIVLIDEIELHLHPAWQRKLVQALREEQSNNQYIITTHSPFVKQLFFEDDIIELGDLGEQL